MAEGASHALLSIRTVDARTNRSLCLQSTPLEIAAYLPERNPTRRGDLQDQATLPGLLEVRVRAGLVDCTRLHERASFSASATLYCSILFRV